MDSFPVDAIREKTSDSVHCDEAATSIFKEREKEKKEEKGTLCEII